MVGQASQVSTIQQQQPLQEAQEPQVRGAGSGPVSSSVTLVRKDLL